MKQKSNLISKEKIKTRVLEERQPTKISIKEIQFWLVTICVIIHTLLLMVLFISTLFDNYDQRQEQNITPDQIASLSAIFVRTVVVYVANNVIDFVFVAYVFLARKKIKIGYLFAIVWFMIWILIGVGTLFVYVHIITVLVINLILCFVIVSVMIWIFYNLYVRKQQMNYEIIKKRKSL